MVATSPPSATATPTSSTVPWVVVACSSTMECPAASAAAGSAFCAPASVVSGPLAAVSCVADSERVLRRRGEQHDDPGDHGHDGADAHQDHDGAAVVVARRGVEQEGDVRERAPDRPPHWGGATAGRRDRSSRAGANRARPGRFRRPLPGPACRLPAPRACRSPGRRYRESPGKCRRATGRPYHEAPCHATWPSISARPTRWSTPRGRAWC